MAGINFAFTADNSNFINALHEVTAGVRDASRQIESEGGNIERVFSSIKSGVATLGIATGFGGIINHVKNTRDEFQKLEIAFETFLGSAEERDKIMSQLIHTAAITPFGMNDVAEGAKMLLAYGVAAEDVNSTLIKLGDLAAGLSVPLGDIMYLYGTTIAKPKMDTQDLMQFMGRGIPMAKALAEQFGVAENKVRSLVAAGKVGRDEVIKAIDSLTGEGSMFGGLMEAQSKSIGGQISNIEDSFEQMFNEIGKQTEGVFNITLEATSKIVENWQTVIGVLGAVATAYGVQKAALVLDAGFTKAATNYGYDAEIAQLQALLPLKAEEEKTALQQAVASGNLTEAKAAEIAALREEAQAQLEALMAKESAAKLEEANAIAKAEAAQNKVDAIDEEIEAVWDKVTATMESLTAEEAEAAVTELDTLETMRNEAADVAQAAAEEAKAAAINTATASEARQSLETGINTAHTSSNTAATGILTIAKEKLAIAIGKVNAMLKANQFAIATGAVIALGYAVYKLVTYQTDYQKSLEKVSKATDEANLAGDREVKTLDELNAKLSVTQKGSEEWKAAKDAIVKQFGQYIPQLDEEITKVGDLSTAYYDLVKAIQQANAAKGLKKFLDENDNTDDVTKKFRESLDEFKNSTKISDTGKAILEPILREYSVNSASDKDLYTYIQDQLKIKYGIDKGQYIYDTYATLLKRSRTYGFSEAHQMNRTREFEIDKYRSDMGISDDDYNKIRYGIEKKSEETETKDKSYWASKKKEAVARLEALADIEAKGKEGDKIRKEIAEYNKRLESFDDGSKKKSGATSDQIASKKEYEHRKVLDLLRQQAEERLKIQQDYEYQEWQNRIDLMQEGEAKVIAQMQLDQAKEKTAFEEQKKQAIDAEIARQKALWYAKEDEKAVGNKKYAKRVFNGNLDDKNNNVDQSQIKVITDRYDNLNTQLLSKQKKAEQDRLNASNEAFNNYLKEFGNYQQKRKAIEEEYNKRIAESTNDGERLMNEAQKRKSLSDLDYDEWINTGNIALAFGDISNLSQKTIESLIADMERYRDKVISTFDPDKIQQYENALSSLKMANADNSFGIFADSVPEYFKKRKSVGDQLDSAGANVNSLYEKRAEIYNRIISLQNQIKQGESKGEDVSGLKAELNSAQVELDSNASAAKKAQNAYKFLQEQWDNMDSPEDKFKAICTAVASFAQLVGTLANQASEMCDALGAEGLGEALGYLGDAMGSVQNIASGFAQGGLIGGIAATAGEVMNWVTKIAMAGDAKHQKNIERIQEQIDTLSKSYDKVGNAADNAFSTDASGLIDQQNTLLQQQRVLIKRQMAEEEAKKKTDDDKMQAYRDRLEEIDELLDENKSKAKEAILGEDLKSTINEFASLYAEAWEDGTDAANKSMGAVRNIISSALSEMLKKNIQPAATSFYDALADAMKDGVLTDAELANLDAIKRQIDAMASSTEEQYRKIKERYRDLDELREELTDISFDSVRDDFKSLLTDMETSASDFSNSFSDMMRNALVEGLMNDKYDIMLKEWYDEFAEAMNDHTLTDSERDAMKQKWDAIVEQGIADRNAINDIVGGGAYSQEASSGGWETMGQDQAEELNGRFTALTELMAINNTISTEGNSLTRDILVTLQSLRIYSSDGNMSESPTLLAIKDMMFLSTGYLEDISKYTKRLISVEIHLSNVESILDKRL